jgi:hypothetical protein
LRLHRGATHQGHGQQTEQQCSAIHFFSSCNSAAAGGEAADVGNAKTSE